MICRGKCPNVCRSIKNCKYKSGEFGKSKHKSKFSKKGQKVLISLSECNNISVSKRKYNIRKKSSKKIHRLYVIIYNINYYDKDGEVIVNNPSFYEVHKNYKYEQGTSGSYGLYQEYTTHLNNLQSFKSDIKSYYTSLGIKNIKILASKNKNKISLKLDLLDTPPK
jgi:hypothetical protein